MISKNDKLKSQLLESFFNLGGSFKNIAEFETLESKFNSYLKNIDGDDKDVLEVLKLVKLFKISSSDDDIFELGCEWISPIVERLCATEMEDWKSYDIRVGQIVFSWTKTFEDALKLAKIYLTVLKIQQNYEQFYKDEFFCYLNLLNRFLRADYKEIDHRTEENRSEELKKAFEEYANLARAIALGKGEELKKYEFMLRIREAMFYRDSDSIMENLSLLRATGDKELYKAMKKSVIIFGSHFSIGITKEQYNILVGSNVRWFREKHALSIEDLADYLNVSTNQMGALERGEKKFFCPRSC